MLKNNELRIGNLVMQNGFYGYVYSIDSPEPRKEKRFSDKAIITLFDNGLTTVPIDEIEPIPLTEEWLLKFGFEKYDWFDGCFIKCNNKHLMIQFYEPKQEILIYFTKISKDKDGHKMNGRDYLFKLKKYYVHKLQNLYFTLIDEELKYNKNKP